ncbi:MAG: MgtC/SapB family protein [Acidobacteria bacterium]|nr:MgtC/SapB family protein [Acidobacteriota bacterium]
MELSYLFQQLGIALGLGLLVGLQRESAASSLGGVRTFPLVTLFGALCGLLALPYGGWIIGFGLLALTGLIALGKQAELHKQKPDSGLTTEAAMLLMFAVGAYLISGQRAIAITVGGCVAVLLHYKGQLHNAVAHLDENDLKAIMQFALLSLVILPVLPNRTYGPYAVLNPRQIWWMVVLIVGISLGGYIVYKFFGTQAGILLGGILGGMISSTATTVSYAKRTRATPNLANLAAIVVMIASAVVYARLQLEIAAVAPQFLSAAAVPLSAMLVVLGLCSAALWFLNRNEASEMPTQENPSELKSALFFGLLYAAILFAVAAVKQHFGNRGLYVVAVLSGLTDVDAITLSTAQLVHTARMGAEEGWKIILTATLSNLVFKAGSVAVLGSRALLLKVAVCYGVVMVAGILLLFLR